MPLKILNWNTSGVPEDDIETFLEHVADRFEGWHVLALQEAFRRGHGLQPEVGEKCGGYSILPPTQILGGIEMPCTGLSRSATASSQPSRIEASMGGSRCG